MTALLTFFLDTTPDLDCCRQALLEEARSGARIGAEGPTSSNSRK